MKSRLLIKIGLTLIVLCVLPRFSWAASGKQPITVNGDTVEFKSEGREFVAQGHVEILYQNSKLSCDKARVFIDEKLAIAEGNVKFSKEDGEELEGDIIVYDFGGQTGTIIGPSVRMHPYYGKARLMEKISDEEYLMEDADVSTCDLPHPHYRFRCKEVKMNPGRLLTAKGVKFSILDVPLFYVPSYSQRLTDKRPRFMITPGHNKKFGTEMLGSWRYYLNENAKGVVHLDWYQWKGWAQGVDLNYDTKSFGSGNAKYYRIDEEDTREEIPEANRNRKERSRIELRHKWEISERDHLVLDYFRASDVNFRKDYFFREYERETNPNSFLLLSHVFPNATLSFLGQPRVNKFDTVLQRIPELKLETVNQKIAQTPFYYKNTTTASHLVNALANVGASPDISRIDSSNQLSYVFRFMDIDFNPFAGHRDTYYSRQAGDKEDALRGMFFGGIDMSTKLFKIYEVDSDFMKLNIHRLRHIVTPSIQYRYQHEPTLNKSRLEQLDDVDSLEKQNKVTFGLENKLQTKRGGQDADLVTLILSTDYNIESNSTVGKSFQDFKYDLEFKPYSWWEFDSDAEFDTKGGYFRTLNSDFWMQTGKAHTGLGYRFKKDESSQLTAGFTCPLNPFWKLGIYERFEFKTGELVEQEYKLERDLHCWTMEIIINQREESGVTFLVAFRLKAFPEIGINAEKTFMSPRSQ